MRKWRLLKSERVIRYHAGNMKPKGIGFLILLAMAGLLSATLTVTIGVPRALDFFFVGFFFSSCLAACLYLYEAFRDPKKVAGFICASTAAYPAAVFTAFKIDDYFPLEQSMSSPHLAIAWQVYFGAGFVGALILVTALVILFTSNRWANSIGPMILASIGGGILGVCGASADTTRNHGGPDRTVLLFLIWQPGIAFLLGLFLGNVDQWSSLGAVPTRSEIANSQTSLSARIVKWVFFTCVFGFLAFLLFNELRSKS